MNIYKCTKMILVSSKMKVVVLTSGSTKFLWNRVVDVCMEVWKCMNGCVNEYACVFEHVGVCICD